MNLETIPLIKDIVNFWKGLDKAQKRNIVVVTVLAVVLIVGVTLVATRVNYALLFGDLTPEQAQSIVSQLESQRIAYRISSDGTSVYVPENKVATLRLQFASSGIVGSTKAGYEIFDRISNVFLTQEEQQVMYQRALEGELERTIGAIPGVKTVRVHLSLPQRSLWTVTSTQVAEGAVYVSMKPGYSLSQGQVEAIRQLVAHSVQNLKPEAVVVVDGSSGIVSGGSSGNLSGDYLEVKKQLENLYASKIRALLGEAFGQENIMVSADVDLEISKQSIQSETWGSTATRSISTTESLNGYGTNGGLVGTATNSPGAIPSYTYTTTGENPMSVYRQQQINYEISRTISQIVPQEINVKSVKITAIVDNSVFSTYQVSASTVEAIVASAAGLSPARGDSVSIASIPFATLARQQEEETTKQVAAKKQKAQLYMYIAVGAGTLILLLAMFLILRSSRKRVGKRMVPAMAPAGVGSPSIAHAPSVPISFDKPLTPEEEKIKAALKEIQTVVEQHPNEVADIVRMWAEEDNR
ncbi:flagellar M-ring protein FliF [Coprothermobacteraceae bacterium]|nr:flagellar M-ring protein FliF [Coprothermobacteraceae bacterium]